MKANHKANLIGKCNGTCVCKHDPRSHMPHIELMGPHDCNDGTDTQLYSFQ